MLAVALPTNCFLGQQDNGPESAGRGDSWDDAPKELDVVGLDLRVETGFTMGASVAPEFATRGTLCGLGGGRGRGDHVAMLVAAIVGLAWGNRALAGCRAFAALTPRDYLRPIAGSHSVNPATLELFEIRGNVLDLNDGALPDCGRRLSKVQAVIRGGHAPTGRCRNSLPAHWPDRGPPGGRQSRRRRTCGHRGWTASVSAAVRD